MMVIVGDFNSDVMPRNFGPSIRALSTNGESDGVMAGPVPAIHILASSDKNDVDARHKLALGPAQGRTRVAGHDVGEIGTSQPENALAADHSIMNVARDVCFGDNWIIRHREWQRLQPQAARGGVPRCSLKKANVRCQARSAAALL